MDDLQLALWVRAAPSIRCQVLQSRGKRSVARGRCRVEWSHDRRRGFPARQAPYRGAILQPPKSQIARSATIVQFQKV